MFISSKTDNITVGEQWARPAADVLNQFADLPAAAVGDALERITVLDGGILLLTTRDGLVGFALPLEVRPGENLAIHRALDEARPGDTLVVNGRVDLTRALIGDVLGEIPSTAGVTGAVASARPRDAQCKGLMAAT